MVTVETNGQKKVLPLVVVKGKGPPLLGRNWLAEVVLDWQTLTNNFANKIETGQSSQSNVFSSDIQPLLMAFKELFQEGLGEMKGIQARVRSKPESTPKFFKPRSVPYALKERIEEDLKRLEQLGVIEQISHSDWAAPIVPVIKSTGAVRICGDFKVTVNPNLEVDKYPLPKPEDLFTSLQGGQRFSTLDFKDAYLQMTLDVESQKFLVINTHKGLYQYKRLPFGISSAPAVFQRAMDTILQGLEGVVCYIDDVLVTGKTTEQHLKSVEIAFSRILEYGLRLNWAKCRFLENSVEYRLIGQVFILAPRRCKPLLMHQRPQIRAFLGLVMYYGKFIKNLSSLSAPLNQLLRNEMEVVRSL